MGNRIVGFRGIHYFGHPFVGHELKCGEGNGHSKGRWVGDVEGGETFISEDGFGAGQDRWVC